MQLPSWFTRYHKYQERLIFEFFNKVWDPLPFSWRFLPRLLCTGTMFFLWVFQSLSRRNFLLKWFRLSRLLWSWFLWFWLGLQERTLTHCNDLRLGGRFGQFIHSGLLQGFLEFSDSERPWLRCQAWRQKDLESISCHFSFLPDKSLAQKEFGLEQYQRTLLNRNLYTWVWALMPWCMVLLRWWWCLEWQKVSERRHWWFLWAFLVRHRWVRWFAMRTCHRMEGINVSFPWWVLSMRLP